MNYVDLLDSSRDFITYLCKKIINIFYFILLNCKILYYVVECKIFKRELNTRCQFFFYINTRCQLPQAAADQPSLFATNIRGRPTTRVYLTGGNRSGLTGYRSNRSGPGPVWAGTKPAQIQNLNLNSKK